MRAAPYEEYSGADNKRMNDAPVTHYAHIERPRQLAALLIGVVRWVMQ
jgi:hypothetical protein